MSFINDTTNVDALQEILDELIQIEANIDMATYVVANINRNMNNYQYALNNINDDYYNINNILPPPFFAPIEEDEEPTIMDGILAEEEARRDEAARIIQDAWMTKKLYG
jgi:hypothetical protein